MSPGAPISIAMATCNGERFVLEQLESFANQSRLPDELIVYDDASEDDTFAKVEAFASRAPFEVLTRRNPRRLGITANFERAIAACTGDIIFLADQDDVWLPEKIATLARMLSEHPETGAVFCDGDAVEADGSPLGYSLWRSLGFGTREQAMVRRGQAIDVFLRHVVAAGTTLAFRSSLRDLALPFPALHSCHDAFVAFVAAATSRVEIAPESLIRYRLHDANQIGIRKLDFAGQLAKAREQIETGAFPYAVEFFQAARERLAAAPPQTLAKIDQKILHASRRASMPSRLGERLGAIRQEVQNRGYWHYSYGWKSVAQDLLLR
jgi:hypothetical protein